MEYGPEFMRTVYKIASDIFTCRLQWFLDNPTTLFDSQEVIESCADDAFRLALAVDAVAKKYEYK